MALPVALGLKVRTGRATVVLLAGPKDAPQILAKASVQVAFTFEEGAVFHMAQERPLDEARTFLRDAEQRFVKLARKELAALVAKHEAKILGAAMAAPAEKKLPPVESILKAHPLVHAAEGELYRRVFIEAAAAFGPRPARVPADELGPRVEKALESPRAKVATRLAALGKASGKPWAAEQKEAALAAWLALVTSS